jgi:hypothetical protein
MANPKARTVLARARRLLRETAANLNELRPARW